jgi:hypothetical protein
VDITNPSLSPSVDLTAFTNASGIVYLPGAATSTDYRVSVSKSGYSSAQTYARDATNQNPTPGYLTVVANQTTTGTFAIDLLSSFTLRTYSPIATSTWSDSFNDATKLASQANTAVAGSSLTLSSSLGVYAPAGSAVAIAVAPTLLASWIEASSTAIVPAGTSFLAHIQTAAGALVPDSDLPGNSAGFSSFPIPLSGLSTTTYPSLALAVDFATADTAVAPALTNWSLGYRAGPTPLGNVTFTLAGSKTIGSTGAGAPIYKTSIATSTNASGVKALSLEWDAYSLSLASYDAVDACSAPPYSISPGASSSMSLMLGANTANSALVTVLDDAGAIVPGASVTLSRTGYTSTVVSSSCGTAYFGGVGSASDYTVTITKTGYTTAVYANVQVSGDTYYAAAFD